jgi:hypothetical protein
MQLFSDMCVLIAAEYCFVLVCVCFCLCFVLCDPAVLWQRQSKGVLLSRMSRLGPLLKLEANPEEVDPQTAVAGEHLQQLQGRLTTIASFVKGQKEMANILEHGEAFNAAQRSLFLRVGSMVVPAGEEKNYSGELDEAIALRRAVVDRAENSIELVPVKLRTSVQKLQQIEGAVAKLLDFCQLQLKALPPSEVDSAAATATSGEIDLGVWDASAGRGAMQQLDELWREYRSAHSQVAAQEMAVMCDAAAPTGNNVPQTLILAAEQCKALEEAKAKAKATAGAASRALPAVLDTVETYLAGVGPARRRRKRQQLEDHVSQAWYLKEQVEEALFVFNPVLEAAEALLNRFCIFRAAEVILWLI